MTIKKRIVKFGKKVLSWFSLLIPKNDLQVVFITNPDFTGNGMAFFEYLYKEHKNFKIIWFLKKTDDVEFRKDVIYIKQKSLRALWLYIRSKYIVTTHNEMIGIKSNNQIYLSLWHGMPLKKIGYLADSEADEMESYSAQRIATSEIMRAIIASSFKEDASNVHVLGQPRNDYLFNMKNLLKPSTEKIIGGKNILYMPTFRKNTNNSEFSDGVEMSDDNFLRVLDFNLEEINRFLKNNNSRLYLKFHPFEEKLLPKDLESEQIKIITSDYCKRNSIDVNSILAETDVLITDYSSVYFDFLILNKPIIFLIPDVKEYSSLRGGYTLEPLEYWMPGEHVYNQSELLFSLIKIIQNDDEHWDKRTQVNSLINRHNDGNNCQRLFDKFFDGQKND